MGSAWQTNEFSTQREAPNRCIKSVDSMEYSAIIVITGRGEIISRLEDHTELSVDNVKLLHIFI